MFLHEFSGIRGDAARIESYRYGGGEYEEVTYGGMVVMKMNKIKKRFA